MPSRTRRKRKPEEKKRREENQWKEASKKTGVEVERAREVK